ncbi:LysR family transcriptional regulator [Alteromonas sp. C1M14]|uniref:LysR family transcriptional regulator n=1 Tax=Alteromonas sp. C1M14 TaxID=2841567 RepID=UPI001C09DA89|nr:LysR family transcriptional regulator [Alteromonas sp. C1M14]MBU2978814.1 LysR family transcriptional regulator [Alteromonas sp. C1M14]
MKSNNVALARLDLNLLPILDQLLRTQSVAETAQILALSSPTVSRALAKLRNTFHDQLLVRSGRHLVRTPKAEALQADLNTLLALAEALTSHQTQHDMATSQRVFKIRCDGTLAGIVSRKLIPLIQQQAPQAGLHFIGESPRGDFRDDDVDLELSGRRSFPPETVVKQLGKVPLVGLVAKGHKLLSGPVTEQAMMAYPHILATIQTQFSKELNLALGRFGLQRTHQFMVPSFFSAALSARESNGIATMPAIIAEPLHITLDMAQLRLPDAWPQVEVFCAWHVKYRDDFEHQWFRAVVEDCMKDIAQGSWQ